MHALLLCLGLVAFQDPEPLPIPADIVELTNGVRLEGTILEDTPLFVKMRLGDDTVVGFERARLAKIERGVGAMPVSGPAALAPVDEWFVLHDSEGIAVGWLHATVAAGPDGGLRLGEEWQFRTAERVTEVTRVEVAGAELEPVSCFVHERSRRADGRIVHERVVRGTIEADHLIVERSTLTDRNRTVYPVSPDTRFVLAAVEELRQRPASAGLGVGYKVYDALREEFVASVFTTDRQRRVEWKGAASYVRELVADRGAVVNTEWLAGKRQILRREINGSSLVALPATAEEARKDAQAGRAVGSLAFRVSPDRRLRMWLPHPAWQFGDPVASGVTARDPATSATACLLAMDHLDDSVLDTAADTVTRWLGLVHPEFLLRERAPASLRGHPAVRLACTWVDGRDASQAVHEAEVWVFRWAETTLVLSLAAPARELAVARLDLQRIRDTVELAPDVPASRFPEVAQRR
jgi:hypothetical protein